MKKTLLAILSLLIGACAAPVPSIDVSQSANLVQSSIGTPNKPVVSSVEVTNSAPPPVPAENPAFSASYIPVGANTAETVSADLKAYFADATVHGAPETQRVIARIEKADAYWVEPASIKVPIFGLLALGGDREFFMNVRISFEVEEHGKVARTFTINERFSIPDGKGGSQAEIARSYRRLVTQYRERFFASLDKSFTTRYLN